MTTAVRQETGHSLTLVHELSVHSRHLPTWLGELQLLESQQLVHQQLETSWREQQLHFSFGNLVFHPLYLPCAGACPGGV